MVGSKERKPDRHYVEGGILLKVTFESISMVLFCTVFLNESSDSQQIVWLI